MENTPRSETTRYTDILAKLENHKDFLRQIANVEESIAEIDIDEALPSEPLEILDSLLDIDGTEVPAIFSGIAYKIDDEDELIDEPIVLDKPLVFGGANYYFVDEKPRIFFDLRDESSEPHICYATPFEAMLRLQCEQPDLNELFARHISTSRGMISNPEFLAADREEQDDLLKSMAVSCFEELAPIIDMANSSVECTEFYEHFDDPNEKGFALEKIDQTDVPFEGRTAVTGIVMGVIYPEAMQRESAFESQDDFTYGGVPCLTVRNDEAGVTTFIPIDRIESIETND